MDLPYFNWIAIVGGIILPLLVVGALLTLRAVSVPGAVPWPREELSKIQPDPDV